MGDYQISYYLYTEFSYKRPKSTEIDTEKISKNHEDKLGTKILKETTFYCMIGNR